MRRFIVAVAATFACAVACDDAPTSHLYVAALYDPPSGSNGANGCLEVSGGLDTVPGESGSLLCAPACLVRATAGGGSQVYVSTMCGPYPSGLDESGTNAACPGALAAYQGGCTCGGGCAQDGGAADAASGDAASGDDGGGDAASSDGGDAASGDDGGGDAATSDGGDAGDAASSG